MAKSNPFTTVIRWIAPDAVWDGVKWIGGSSILSSLGKLVFSEIHRNPVDWTLLGALFGGGAILSGCAGYRERKAHAENFGSPSLLPASGPTVTLIDDEDRTLYFSSLDEKQQYISVHDRGYQCLLVLNELQIEGLTLAKRLATFLKECGPQPSEVDTNMFDDIYAEGLSEDHAWKQFHSQYMLDFHEQLLKYHHKLVASGIVGDGSFPVLIGTVKRESGYEKIIASLRRSVIQLEELK